jgi:hypothetical protein
MNIGNFAKKPELIKIEINDPDITANYNGEVSFWLYDSVDINTYFNFFKSQADQDGSQLNELLRNLILDEQGNKAILEGNVLPVDLAIAAITAINERLGKSKTKASIPESGNQLD